MTATESNTACQCKAITSSGKQCTRQRRIGFNGYCAQHAKANESTEVEQRPDPIPVSTVVAPALPVSSVSDATVAVSNPWDYANVKARATGGQHRTPSPADNGDKPVTNVEQMEQATGGTILSGQERLNAMPKTEFQSKFLAKLQSKSDDAPHLIVEARAGTGKTTTLIEGLKRLKGVPSAGFVPSPQQEEVFRSMELSRGKVNTICFVAFNKSIATELKARVPSGCEAMTMHGMGFKAIRRAFGNDINVSGDKLPPRVPTILAEITGTPIKELRRGNATMVNAVIRLVSLCKMNLTDATEPRNLDDLAAHYDVELNGSRDKVIDLVPKVLERCKDVQRDGCIDFDDMIWLPVILDLPVFRYDLLLVDEAQDLNRCQQALAKKAGRRLILCGDPAQAIYGFAGADAESMPRMEQELKEKCEECRGVGGYCTDGREGMAGVVTEPCSTCRGVKPRGCNKLPLTVTRRCGKAIVKEAQRIVREFTAHESNPDGKVTTMRYPLQPGSKRGETVQIKIEDTYVPHVRDGDMVLCRSNAPLVRECLRFIKLGRRATIQGRDVGQGIINLVIKLDASSIPDLTGKLDAWYIKEVTKENAKDHPREHFVEALGDRRSCILAFTESANTVDDVVRKIESIFNDRSDLPGILLSSIHRAKGLESGTVFLLSPDVQPRRPAEKLQPWELEQESNLEYVGITRAINHLVRVY